MVGENLQAHYKNLQHEEMIPLNQGTTKVSTEDKTFESLVQGKMWKNSKEGE